MFRSVQLNPPLILPTKVICLQIIVSGVVQGVGFRPFVFRLANELNIKGYVANDAGQVTIVAKASKLALNQFCVRLLNQAPVNAKPIIKSVSDMPRIDCIDFSIRPSQTLHENDIHILSDLATCKDCVAELFDRTNRRYLYPFINCTQCGPRYSIIYDLPYDRSSTTMRGFKTCPDCEAEYQSPADRRFHAEPIACENCGPVLSFVDATHTITDNAPALQATVAALNRGNIVAIKGIGGYHLMCDATSIKAIEALRRRKQRPHKPFAVMMHQSLLDHYVEMSEREKALLEHSSAPIVLMKHHRNHNLPDCLAPGINRVGVMLPSNPLQHLLCHYIQKPLLATSANLAGEPIISDNILASKRLVPLCDAFLHHNRDIVRPADDPVMIHDSDKPQIMRNGRGTAPTEFTLPFLLDKPVLAVGGHIKNTVALAWQNRMVVSAHNGDLGSLRSYQTFQRRIADLQTLYQTKAEHVLCDTHPGYGSTRWANESGLPVTTVLHHHAHASSLLLENPGHHPLLVFCWDGIGLGDDGTLWGGETFLGSPGKWSRVASLRSFRLPGGERTAREAWRVAASLCWHTSMDYTINNPFVAHVKAIWLKEINCPLSSSVGRLFSAAAALLGLVDHESFEGQGPMLLEALAETTAADGLKLSFVIDDNGITRIDWESLIEMLGDNALGKAYRARCFHETLAECVKTITLQHRENNPHLHIGLSGGVFQNQLLLKLIKQRLDKLKIPIVLSSRIPVNDGGICAGQVIEYHYR